MRIEIKINPYGRKPAWAGEAERTAMDGVETVARAWLVRAVEAQRLCAEVGDFEPFNLKDAIADAREWLAERDAERDSAARVAATTDAAPTDAPAA